MNTEVCLLMWSLLMFNLASAVVNVNMRINLTIYSLMIEYQENIVYNQKKCKLLLDDAIHFCV